MFLGGERAYLREKTPNDLVLGSRVRLAVFRIALSERDLLGRVGLSRLAVLSQEVTKKDVGLPLRTAEINNVDVMGAYQRPGPAYKDVAALGWIAAILVAEPADGRNSGLDGNASRYSDGDVRWHR